MFRVVPADVAHLPPLLWAVLVAEEEGLTVYGRSGNARPPGAGLGKWCALGCAAVVALYVVLIVGWFLYRLVILHEM